MKKSAQAAMEFLMTYGWAILVVLVAIGTLAYSGVLGGAFFLPEKCVISTGSGLFCEDFSASTGKITLKVRNALANPVQITEVVISQGENSCNLTSIDGNEELPGNIAASSSAVLILDKGDTCHILTAAGTKLKGDIYITFVKKHLEKITTGNIVMKTVGGAGTGQPPGETSCGDGSCNGDETCSSCPTDCPCPSGEECINDICQPPGETNCGDDNCDVDETCISCPADCGQCSYGTVGANDDVVCGAAYYLEDPSGTKWIRRKDGNLDISEPEPPMKTTIDEWVFSDPAIYHQIRNGQFDGAVQRVFQEVWTETFPGHGWLSPCPIDIEEEGEPADTTSHELLTGSSGNCIDWSALIVSLLRTMNVPSNRVFMVGYISVQGGHAISVYITDSGDHQLMDVTCGNGIKSSFSEFELCKCITSEFNTWGSDQSFGWGLNGVDCGG